MDWLADLKLYIGILYLKREKLAQRRADARRKWQRHLFYTSVNYNK